MIEIALEYTRTDTAFKAIQYLESSSDPKEVLDAYHLLSKELYWNDRDLANVIIVMLSGIAYAQRSAQTVHQDDPGASDTYKDKARKLAYNLASFTWPGWGEEGLNISEVSQQIGHSAARLNLQICEELNLDDTAMARAYWMNGAHHLTLADTQEALFCFERSLKHADWADNRGETLLAQGFMVLAENQLRPDSTAESKMLASLFDKLEEVEHGGEFIQQIETARRVLEEE